MGRFKNRPIRVVSHGPACLDGTVAAAVVARFYGPRRVIAVFAANQESDTVLQHNAQRWTGRVQELWITDLSWKETTTAARLAELAHAGTRIYWIDHHRSAIVRRHAPEFSLPLAGRRLSERFSAARLVYDYLRQHRARLNSGAREGLEGMARLVAMADDHDRWVHRIAGSHDWALAVQALGGTRSYREILKLDEPRLTPALKAALKAARAALAQSLALAEATIVERDLTSGQRLRAACCNGYSSEVASSLYEGRKATVVALFDLRSFGVSLRRSPDCGVDLSEVAHSFGGGGHAAAAGFSLDGLKRFPAEKLAELVGAKIESAAGIQLPS